MRFNISRLLVRLRQFWTRKRLVPVLGFTALALFLLNFSVFIGHQFKNAPLNASYITGWTYYSGDHAQSGSFSADADRRFHKHIHKRGDSYFWGSDHKHSRRKCKNEKKRRKSYEHYFEAKRFNEQAKRFNEEAERFQVRVEQQREEIERLHQEIQHEQLHELNLELKKLDKSIVIKRLDGQSELDVTIMVDGKVVDGP